MSLLALIVTPPTDTVPGWVFACGLLLCAGAVVVVLLGMRRRGDD